MLYYQEVKFTGFNAPGNHSYIFYFRAMTLCGPLKRGLVRTSKGNPQVLDNSIRYKRMEGRHTVSLGISIRHGQLCGPSHIRLYHRSIVKLNQYGHESCSVPDEIPHATQVERRGIVEIPSAPLSLRGTFFQLLPGPFAFGPAAIDVFALRSQLPWK